MQSTVGNVWKQLDEKSWEYCTQTVKDRFSFLSQITQPIFGSDYFWLRIFFWLCVRWMLYKNENQWRSTPDFNKAEKWPVCSCRSKMCRMIAWVSHTLLPFLSLFLTSFLCSNGKERKRTEEKKLINEKHDKMDLQSLGKQLFVASFSAFTTIDG